MKRTIGQSIRQQFTICIIGPLMVFVLAGSGCRISVEWKFHSLTEDQERRQTELWEQIGHRSLVGESASDHAGFLSLADATLTPNSNSRIYHFKMHQANDDGSDGSMFIDVVDGIITSHEWTVFVD